MSFMVHQGNCCLGHMIEQRASGLVYSQSKDLDMPYGDPAANTESPHRHLALCHAGCVHAQRQTN